MPRLKPVALGPILALVLPTQAGESRWVNRLSRKAVGVLAADLKSLVHRRRIKDRRPPALSPDTLIHVGEQKTDQVSIHVIDYGPDEIRETITDSIEECVAFETRETPTWIQVTGLHDTGKISALLEAYGIHPLVQSDIVNTRQQPKAESFDDYLFVVTKLIVPDADGKGMLVENFSLLLIDKVLITFEEAPTALFEPVLVRLRNTHSRARRSDCDYLLWALLDAVVDNYFVALEKVEDEVERFDALLLQEPRAIDPGPLHTLKQEIFYLHRIIRPAREVVARLSRGDTGLVAESTLIYFRDLYDHVTHAIEIAENLREASSSLRDFYLAAVSNRMNEIMKVLTCFSTIFLPLTFLAGVYGMNFKYMPELAIRWAYPALWGIFLLLSGGMFVFFRHRKWL